MAYFSSRYRLGVKTLGTFALYLGALYTYDGPGFGKFFFYHPMCMLLGFLPFMAAGVFVNKYNRLLIEAK